MSPQCHRIPRAEATLSGVLGTALSLEECKRVNNGAQWAHETNPGVTGSAETQSFFYIGGVPGLSADIAASPASPSALFHGSGRLRVAVDGTEENVRLYREQDRDLTSDSVPSYPPIERPDGKGGAGHSIISQLGRSRREIRDTWMIR